MAEAALSSTQETCGETKVFSSQMLVMDDAGIARLQKRYEGRDGYLIEVTDTHVTLYEIIGSVKCPMDRWQRVDDVTKHVSIIR